MAYGIGKEIVHPGPIRCAPGSGIDHSQWIVFRAGCIGVIGIKPVDVVIQHLGKIGF